MPRTITVTSVDSESGLRSLTYSIDGGPEHPALAIPGYCPEGENGMIVVLVGERGDKAIKFRINDNDCQVTNVGEKLISILSGDIIETVSFREVEAYTTGRWKTTDYDAVFKDAENKELYISNAGIDGKIQFRTNTPITEIGPRMSKDEIKRLVSVLQKWIDIGSFNS